MGKIIIYAMLAALVLIAVIALLAVIDERFHIGVKKQETQPQRPLTAEDQRYYEAYLKALIRCVKSNRTCGLECPGELPQHLPTGRCPIMNHNGHWFYLMAFNRVRHWTGGMGKFVFDTTPMSQIIARLNETLPNFCIAEGLPAAQIVCGHDIGQGRILFTVEVMI